VETAAPPASRLTIKTETLLRGVLGPMLALSCLSFIEPSPYEFFFILLIPVALLSGLALTRTTLTLFFLIFAVVVSQLVALFPYIQHPPLGENNLTPALYSVYTVYLYASALLFALIFSRNAGPRLTLCIKAYGLSCVFAGLWGIASYLDIGGLGAQEPIAGRVAGPFKDPNVLGSYCILGALYYVQHAVLGARRRLLHFACFLVVTVGGVFLSFSRGSWGAMIAATFIMGVSTYLTGDKIARRRVRRSLGVLALLAGVGVGVVAATPVLRETITERAKLEQDYDGENGRFGNQKRSIPMLIERPLGFGPFRFPMHFTLQPHNSYIGAFADGGWIGGFAFLLLVAASSVITVRLLFLRSPLLRQAQVIGPALIGFFLQALQIDIDHWRFVFLMVGAVWGMQSALTPREQRMRESSSTLRAASPAA
jgi:hypothetical protein